MVGGDAPFQSFEPLVVAQDVQVLAGHGGGPLLDDLADQPAVVLVVEPEAGVQALLDGGLAARTGAKMKVMAGSRPSLSSRSMTGPAGRPRPRWRRSRSRSASRTILPRRRSRGL
ncbi:hypothetical protein SCALM49S_00003 [Streptomyces californicus]